MAHLSINLLIYITVIIFSRNMTPMRSKMLIGMFILVKGLLFAFITQPWAVFPTVKNSIVLMK